MKNKSHIINVALMFILFTVASPAIAQASDYYVDTNNGSASDSNPGTSSMPWKTITKANQTLVAGDTLFIKAGTYASYIAPVNSGTPSSSITYQNFGTDVVTIQNTSNGILLDGKSYVKVQGINFYNLDAFMYLQNGANHNIIAYCNFNQMRSFGNWSGSKIYYSSSYNWVHHCTYSRWGQCGGSSTQGSVLDIGNEEVNNDFSEHNLIENSTLFEGGHHVLGLFGRYNTIRNNYFYSDGWMSGGRGGRNIYVNGPAASSGTNVIEGNRIGYTAADCGTSSSSVGASEGMQISNSYNVVRYNAFYYNNISPIHFSETSNYINNANYNKAYNNTFFANDQNTDPYWNPDAVNTAIAFTIYDGTWQIRYNDIRNNLFYHHKNYSSSIFGSLPSGLSTYQTFGNNFNGDAMGDPKFINASTTIGPLSDSTYPNLNLQSGSPAINSGIYLTQASGSGTNSQTLTILDARYFQDGTFAPAGTISPDWIAVGTVSNFAQISSVNYSTNTITLATPITWVANAKVWLYKKSDGVRVLYGSAPDAGAYSYVQASSPGPAAPTNLMITAP
jgi:hypothetical protein